MYQQVSNVQKFHIMATECIRVFCTEYGGDGVQRLFP
jgi:hypothetical protein